jgi:hypothetical protein
MSKFKDDKEWFKEAKRLHQEQGLNAAQIREKIGFHEGFRIDNSSSQGIRKINLATKLKKDTLRNSKGKVPDSTRQFFPNDKSHKTYTQTVGRDKSGINTRTRQATLDRGILYHKGHIQSSDLGGSTTSRNLRLENGSNNSSHGRVSPSRGALLNTGAPVDWNNDAINYLDPDGLPLEYSPQAKQRILNAPADMVDEVTAQVDKEVWDRIKKNPDARPIRTNPNPRVSNPPTKQRFNGLSISAFDQGITPSQSLRIAKKTARGASKAAKWLLPGASLSIGFGQAGHAASQGDYAGAAAHGVGALVGEVPLIGDAVVESVAGTGLADGTLQGNLNRVPKQGPKNTAAPTGDKKFDNVFQPFNQMLNGITPTPKKPDFKQTAISAFNTP